MGRKDTSRVLCNRNVHYRDNNSPPLPPIVSHINHTHILAACSLKSDCTSAAQFLPSKDAFLARREDWKDVDEELGISITTSDIVPYFKWINSCMDGSIVGWIDRQKDIQVDRQTEEQAERKTEGQTEGYR